MSQVNSNELSRVARTRPDWEKIDIDVSPWQKGYVGASTHSYEQPASEYKQLKRAQQHTANS